ncbi:hypothetical protein [Streptosporangium subroseum]|uniref:hypothetical protein n=1 Tax=Streptosporangium subroseum TaxID=106412 RepID=UPI003086D351|nr:hypothetical protein OHB15_09465 [Streptosporangium subroseum]
MKLQFVRSTSPTNNTCPTLFTTDRETVIVQGYVVTDPEALSQMDIPEGETCVEVPLALLEELREVFANAR